MLASEIRFEGSPELVGGSLVVSYDGKLVGAMGATVAQPGRSSAISLNILKEMRRGLGGGFMPSQGFRPGTPHHRLLAFAHALPALRRRPRGRRAPTGVRGPRHPGRGRAPAVERWSGSSCPAPRRAGAACGWATSSSPSATIRSGGSTTSSKRCSPSVRAIARPLRLRHDGTDEQVDVAFAKSKE